MSKQSKPSEPSGAAAPAETPKLDAVCEHGTAMDVHCCNCHSGFIFDMGHECPALEQSEDTDMVATVTAIVRDADQMFTKSGGSSRHWVRECFLPKLNAAGLRIVPPPAEPQEAPRPDLSALADDLQEAIALMPTHSEPCATCGYDAAGEQRRWRQALDLVRQRIASPQDAAGAPKAAELVDRVRESVEFWRERLISGKVQGIACDMLEDFDSLVNPGEKGRA